MTVSIRIRCDKCGQEKASSNGWLIARMRSPEVIEFQAWNERRAKSPNAIHICGALCAQRVLQIWTPVNAPKTESEGSLVYASSHDNAAATSN